MNQTSVIKGCLIVLLLIAISAVRYIDFHSNEHDTYAFSSADFSEKLHPAQLLLLGEKIDINTADVDAFEVLYRVGPKLARRIVEDREKNGPFRSIDDLKRVYGIGPKTIQNNSHYLKHIPLSVDN